MRLTSTPLELLKRWLFPFSAMMTALGLGIVVGVYFATRVDEAARTDFLDAQIEALRLETALDRPTAPTARSDGSQTGVPTDQTPPSDDAVLPSTPTPDGSSTDELAALREDFAQLERGGRSMEHRHAVLRQVATLAPSRALARIGIWTDENRRAEAFLVIAEELATKDPAAGLKALDSLGATSTAGEFSHALIPQLARRKPTEVVPALNAIPAEGHRTEIVDQLFRHWTATDPAVAVDGAMQLAPGDERARILAMIASARADGALEQVARAFARITDPVERDRVMAGFFAAREESLAAADFARSLLGKLPRPDPDDAGAEFAVAVLAQLAAVDEGALAPLVRDLPPGTDRGRLVASLVERMARQAPDRAARLAVELADGVNRVGVLRSAASALARADGPAALAWLGSIADQEERLAAMQAVLFELRDLDAAERWLTSREAGSELESALHVFVARLAREDAARAAPWALRIIDPVRRHLAIEAVARAWQRNDRTAAEAWLQETDLPAFRAERLLAR